jgi:DNA topoisomerase IA
LNWERGKTFDKEIALMVLDRIKTQDGLVERIRTEEVVKQKPMGLTLPTLLRVASKKFGIGALDTLKSVEYMY